MDNKKEIGRKIWDLFLKKYSYGEIAKELNINKSVVSNIINYSMPPNDWCNEKIEEIRKTEEELKKQLNKKNEKIKELEEETEEQNEIIKLGLISISIYLIAVAIILYFFNLSFYHNLLKIGLFIGFSIVFIFAILYFLAFLKYKDWI
jgi:predicted transcriptional regulator